jgi:hypothetical protein
VSEKRVLQNPGRVHQSGTTGNDALVELQDCRRELFSVALWTVFQNMIPREPTDQLMNLSRMKSICLAAGLVRFRVGST